MLVDGTKRTFAFVAKSGPLMTNSGHSVLVIRPTFSLMTTQKARDDQPIGSLIPIVWFGWRYAGMISLLARHIEKLVRAFALGINAEAL